MRWVMHVRGQEIDPGTTPDPGLVRDINLRQKSAPETKSKTGPKRFSQNWVPKGSLAGVFGCHEMALELVSGSNFWCNLMSGGSPGRSNGDVPGSIPDLKPRRTGPNNFNQTAFRYPGLLTVSY